MLNFPNWLRIIWWGSILVLLGWLLSLRYADLAGGSAAPTDLFLLTVLVLLAVVPLFSEISFPGITVKHQLREFKAEVKDDLRSLRSEINAAVTVRTQIAPQFLLAPPPDSQLPRLEEHVRATVEEILARRKESVPPEKAFVVPGEIQLLFAARYNLELEIRRLWEQRLIPMAASSSSFQARRFPVARLLDDLVRGEALDAHLAHLIREAYSVCSPAIHGEGFSNAQVDFVRDAVPGLIASLRAVG